VLRSALVLSVIVGIACGADESISRRDDFSTALTPTQTGGHYTDQANKYFDALDETADPDSLPTYSLLVVRWEWPPWLYLTGLGAQDMKAIDEAVKVLTPAEVVDRDCRAFAVQPFARCRINFQYAEGPCPIYEEFTFNDQGEITWIEAWSDLPAMVPFADPEDLWGEGEGVHRLSTRIPGLGNETGLIDLDGEAMLAAAETDPEIADFLWRADKFWVAWGIANEAAGPDLFARGCGWEASER